MIKRHIYGKVVDTIKEKKIPVIIGLRRIGKTTILKQMKEEFKNDNARIISWDSFDMQIMDDTKFFNYIKEECKQGGLLLFDEVQERNKWDIMIKNIFDQFVSEGICRVVVTGSSSMILVGKEMGVDRTRRIFLDTWNFDEYCELTNKEKTIANFENFLGKGFPNYMNDKFDPLVALNETLKPIIQEDILTAYPQLDTTLLLRFLVELSALTNGEVNETRLSKKAGITIVTVRKYIEVLIQTNLIKRIMRIDGKGNLPRKKQYKIFINPHIHVWLLRKSFNQLENKQKGHIIESYWLNWVLTKESPYKEIFYLKDNNTGKEIDFVTLNPDGSFKTLHEFKYRDTIEFSELDTMFSLKSTNKLVWCKETKKQDGVKYISILDINEN